jgi:hypothetical protein
VHVVPGRTLAEQVRALRSAGQAGRRAMTSAWAGFFVDMFDVYLPVVGLAPAIAYFQPASLNGTEASVLFFTTFAATLLGRPAGRCGRVRPRLRPAWA